MNPFSQLNDRQAAIVRIFQNAHADGVSSAASLHSLRLQRDADFEGLLTLRIVRQAESDPETFYAPLSRDMFGPAVSRRVILGSICLLIVIAAIGFLMLVIKPPIH